jgi:hypothetical protein
MTDASPGPGCWLASDGKWYPPQWEYHWSMTYDRQLEKAMAMMKEEAAKLGLQGWEMVNYATQGTAYSFPQQMFWEVTCFYKRLIIRSN